ncbi:MAG: class I SAM-dependent methyltransferase [Pseudomonadota bacterium]
MNASGPSAYHDVDLVRERVALGEHRDVIGGLWEELGALQFDFLVSQGLMPEDRLLDVGCGSLRAGVRLVPYLQPGRYYGLDLREELLDAGYEREIVPMGLASRLPRANLATVGDFDATGFGVTFNYAIAQSVFTHLPQDELARCLIALAPVFEPGGRFLVTYFERPADAQPGGVAHPRGIVTHADRDPFDFTQEQLRAATVEGWTLDVIGEWGHPRDQRMAVFTRHGHAGDR